MTIVLFVGLCLVGVWMMTSSSVVPVQHVDEPAQEKKTEVKQEVVETNNESNTQQFEDNQGDLPEDATKGDGAVSLAQSQKTDNTQENEEDKSNEENKSDTLLVKVTQKDKGILRRIQMIRRLSLMKVRTNLSQMMVRTNRMQMRVRKNQRRILEKQRMEKKQTAK